MNTNTLPEHVETLVIGAGQAGLATAHHLQQRGRPCLVIDSNARVGDNWRRQWDSLHLYTPAGFDGLPGLPFPAPKWSFPGKDDVGDYLETYARHFALPVHTSTRVTALERDGEHLVATTDRGAVHCDNVVVATGTFGRTPAVPGIAAELDPGILQIHSSEYRRPDQLADGPVLVVGAGHSGADIAHEVAASRPTILAGRDCGAIPFPLESNAMHVMFPVLLFLWRHVLTRATPMGRREVQEVRHHGGPMLRVKAADLADAGVEWVRERVEEVREGRPVVGGRPRDVATVIWATGFRHAFDWIHLPVLGPDGWPEEHRGEVASELGLFFCGLSFQYSHASMLLAGVGRDARHVAERIVARASSKPVVATASRS